MDVRQKLREIAARPHPEEWRRLAWSAAWFFSLLGGYYMLRPVRETYGMTGDNRLLSLLFWLVFIVMLAAIPVYSWLAARLPRRVLVSTVYRLAATCMATLFIALYIYRDVSPAPKLLIGCLYVFISVYNLFVVSVFWSVMADLFSDEQGKRLFGFVTAGGTIGGMCGSLFTSLVVRYWSHFPWANLPATILLLLFSASTLELCLFCSRRLERACLPFGAQGTRQGMARDEGTGGSAWDGMLSVLHSPYLLGICLFLVCGKACATAVYLSQNQIIPQAITDGNAKTQLFSNINFAVQVATLLLQVFVVGNLLRWIGTGPTLMLLPLGYAFGFSVLSSYPTLATIVVFEVLQRAAGYGIAEPARQVLFTVVPRDQKYKSKGFIDTVVVRGGDSSSSTLMAKLMSSLGLSQAMIALLPLTAVWGVICGLLGREERRRSR
jgi:AAA family ATP:ADP antiporter